MQVYDVLLFLFYRFWFILHFYCTALCLHGICYHHESICHKSEFYKDSNRMMQTTAWDSSFLMPKMSAKFQQGHLQWVHQIEVG